MNKPVLKPGTLLMALGLLLIAAALAFTGYNIWDSNRAGEAAAAVITELQIPEKIQPATPILHKSLEEKNVEFPPMATQTINGYDYIGTLEVPCFSLELPVMAQWDYDRLQISPCLYSGSYFTGDLVICGHNYPTHFSYLKSIALNEDIYLTTVDGYRYHYRVDNIETLEPTEISQMVEPTDWELTLFTCHTGGQTRCAIRCSLIQ